MTSVTALVAAHFALCHEAGQLLAVAAPSLHSLTLADSPSLAGLPALAAAAHASLASLQLQRCAGWPAPPAALAGPLGRCAHLAHLTLHLLPNSAAQPAPAAASPAAALAALAACTALRSLDLDLGLPASLSFEEEDPYGAQQQPDDDASPPPLSLAAALSGLRHLQRCELHEAGSAPHPAWRLGVLAALAGLPGLTQLDWRRLELDGPAAEALRGAPALAVLHVERLVAPGKVGGDGAGMGGALMGGGTRVGSVWALRPQVRAVALAAAAAAASAALEAALEAGGGGAGPGGPPGGGSLAAAAHAAATAANAAARPYFPEAAAAAGVAAAGPPDAALRGPSSGHSASLPPQPPPLWRRLLLPLPPALRLLRCRHSGLGGMSLAALAAAQAPPGMTLELYRNGGPKLEIGACARPTHAITLPSAPLRQPPRSLRCSCPNAPAALAGRPRPSAARRRSPRPPGDDDVTQPSGAALLPEAGLALALGLRKLAVWAPQLHTLRLINDARQRVALAPPPGWAAGQSGREGGGHAVWLGSLAGLRGLTRLTLAGLQLGAADVAALAAAAPQLRVRRG